MRNNYSFCRLTNFPISGGMGPENRFPSMLLKFTCINILVLFLNKVYEYFNIIVKRMVRPVLQMKISGTKFLLKSQVK